MSRTLYRYSPSRRRLLQVGAGGAVLAAASSLGAPFVRAQGRSLKIGTYGGYFEESFVNHIYPDFTAATGIAVESIPEPTGEAWLVQLQTAANAGEAPADVSMMAVSPLLRGANAGLWQAFDESALPNAANVIPDFLSRYDDGGLYGVAAVVWYITFVTNTETYPEAPASWGDMWGEDYRNSLGLLALASNSFLLEITATTFFGGTAILDSEEGILEVMAKLEEVKPNVALWYRDEGQFQNALQTGEIPAGQYYHDVTGLAAADGFPVRSTFPREGGVSDRGSWAVTRASDKLEEAQVFIDYMCQPAIQDTLSLKVGTAPIIPRDQTNLSDEDFAAVSSDIPPIIPRYDMYLERGDWINEQWTRMITS